MKKLLLLMSVLPFFIHANIGSTWLQSKAAAYGQQDKWQEAQVCMNQLMVDSPDQPDLVYDNGVAAYRLSEFAKAAAYFENVTKMSHVENDLKKQAHFNWGNTNVALNQLSDAAKQYEQVLAMEPDNAPAQHNLKKVKEMMKQQQQNQQQQNNKQEQSKKNKQNKNDEGNQNEQNHDSKQDQKNDQDGSDNQQNQHKQSSDDTQKDGSSKSSSPRGNEEKKEGANDQQERQQQGEPNDKSSQQNRNQEQNELRDSHDSSSEKQTKQQAQKQRSKGKDQPTKKGSKEQESQKGVLEDTQNDRLQEQAVEQQFGSHEKWMARVLAQQEKADKAAQKALIKTNINKQLAGHDGQNCW